MDCSYEQWGRQPGVSRACRSRVDLGPVRSRRVCPICPEGGPGGRKSEFHPLFRVWERRGHAPGTLDGTIVARSQCEHRVGQSPSRQFVRRLSWRVCCPCAQRPREAFQRRSQSVSRAIAGVPQAFHAGTAPCLLPARPFRQRLGGVSVLTFAASGAHQAYPDRPLDRALSVPWHHKAQSEGFNGR